MLTTRPAVCRYFYYVEVGVSAQHIAPFRQSWIENVLSLLPMEQPTHLDDQYYQQLLEEAVDEMKADYVYSMRKSIMDYITKSPVERRCGPALMVLFSSSRAVGWHRDASLCACKHLLLRAQRRMPLGFPDCSVLRRAPRSGVHARTGPCQTRAVQSETRLATQGHPGAAQTACLIDACRHHQQVA